MSVVREGGCACGAVRYRLASEPLFVHCCHCLNCQRQTGSAFVINLLIEADRVEVLAGAPEPVDVPRDDGSTQRIFRCPACRVAVYSHYRYTQVSFVRGGTLDDARPRTAGSYLAKPVPPFPEGCGDTATTDGRNPRPETLCARRATTSFGR